VTVTPAVLSDCSNKNTHPHTRKSQSQVCTAFFYRPTGDRGARLITAGTALYCSAQNPVSPPGTRRKVVTDEEVTVTAVTSRHWSLMFPNRCPLACDVAISPAAFFAILSLVLLIYALVSGQS
jgi:hypothetical protein